MVELEVKGHSGCQIEVVNEGSALYVYKSTADPKYLRRLVLQAKKQQTAGEVEYQHVRVPKIYELRESIDSTIIKMQYVYSKNFIEFFEQIGFEQVDYLIGALEQFIEYEINKCDLQVVPPIIFRKKFAEIRTKVEKMPTYLIDDVQLKPEIQRIVEHCQKIFDGMKAMRIPVGICHGDLTFSNILFNGNNYYLIDFLDSYIETPLQDIVKIRQDTAYRWSQLMYSKPYDAVRLRIICDKIDKEIDAYFAEKYKWYTDNYLLVQLMNILRILPYAHEKKVIDYLVDILNGLLDEIENGSEQISDQETLLDVSQESKHQTLIMPIAANKPDYEYRMPRVFQMGEEGTMFCVKALQSLDLTKYEHVYITILRSVDERYSISDMLRLQFQIKGIKNADVVILDKSTTSQPDTIYQTIKKMKIKGRIFIKDADCNFKGDNTEGNAIVIYPLELLDWVNPKNKSYVNVDDQYYITNIIEKRVVSHYFTAGGYCFDDAAIYNQYYERFAGESSLYLSHIIYSMMLDNKIFRPVVAKEYEDFESKIY